MSASSARRVTSAILAILAAPSAVLSPAQNAGGDGAISLEEIVVTARKVEENLMDVPIAITAFSSAEIESAGIKQLGDVMLMTPGFNFVNQQGSSGRNDRSASSLVFRGLYLNLNTGLNAGGNLFIDGAPVLGAQPPAIVDVERIEVLKGPQSAYFGRSTFAGAINFVTREPGQDVKGKVIAEVSSWSSYDVSGSFEGGLTDSITGRVTVRDFKRGGQYTNFTDSSGKKLGEQTTQSFSAALVFKPSDSLKIKAYVNVFRDDDGPPAQGALKSDSFTGRVTADGTCVPFSQAPAGTAALGQAANSRASFGYVCGEVPTMAAIPRSIISGDYDTSNPNTYKALFEPNPLWTRFETSFNQDGGIKREALQADLRVDYDFAGGYSLSSLTAAHQDKTMTLIDLNYRNGKDRVNPFYATRPTTTVPWLQALLVSQGRFRDWSQELRLTSPQEQRLRWVVGGNYFSGMSPGGTVYGLLPSGPSFTASITRQEVTTPAVFGAVYYDLTDQLTVSVEGRYQWDKIEQTPLVAPPGVATTGVAAETLSETFTSFSPRISVDYQITDDTLIYGLFSRGFRPGGFNAALKTSPPALVAALLSVVPTASLAFEQEQLDNYEVGIKSTFLDGRARAILTFYKNDWIDGQVGSTVALPGFTNLITITVNNGEAKLEGMEFEGQFQATRNLKLSGTFAYNKSELVSYGVGSNGNCADCNLVYGSFGGAIGNRLPTTPKITYSLTAEYSRPFSDSLDWYTRVDLMHQGEKYTDFSNVAWVGSSDNVNARIGLRSEKMTFEIFGTNITDNKVMTSALLGIDAFTFLVPPNKNEVRFSPPLPQAWGARLSYKF
jgi:iron complex outermembrane receptor protein